MIKKFATGVAIAALAGCAATSPTTTQGVTPGRSILANVAQAPTLEQMKKLIPSSIKPSDVGSLVKVAPDRLRVPRVTTFGAFGLPSIHGLYPFSYGASTWYAPYFWDAALSVYSPFATYASLAYTPYSYLYSPFGYYNAYSCFAPYSLAYGLGWGWPTIY